MLHKVPCLDKHVTGRNGAFRSRFRCILHVSMRPPYLGREVGKAITCLPSAGVRAIFRLPV
jgi:hypothetical protein